MSKSITLVLFDIDGTLLEVHGAGRRAFAQAFQRQHGWTDDIAWVTFAGATDLDIHRQIVERRGHKPAPGEVDAFFTLLGEELEKNLRTATFKIYPGVRELLAVLSKDQRALVGLVTGNDETCAKMKLRHFDIHGHFVLGAFGHEHGDRRDIARLALKRAESALQPGQEIAARYVVGDTPNDIAGAQAIDATCIAVATGRFTPDLLREAGAAHVLNDLADVPRVLELLGLHVP
jgi:phosphoglycolate phosphatase-like HAD superfamily hydrolase